MDESSEGSVESAPVGPSGPAATVSRRDLVRLGFRGAGGLTLAGLVDVPAARAATEEMKLSEVSEFTTSCNFCSCGCGMVATVRDGKLITMEGTSTRS